MSIATDTPPDTATTRRSALKKIYLLAHGVSPDELARLQQRLVEEPAA